jgi:hypothetical protein
MVPKLILKTTYICLLTILPVIAFSIRSFFDTKPCALVGADIANMRSNIGVGDRAKLGVVQLA